MEFIKTIVKYENPNLEIIRNDINQNEIGILSEFCGLTNEEINKNKQLQQEGKKLIKPIGCGNWIRWSEMEDVTEFVKSQLKEINENDIAVIEQIAADPEKLIEEEKYEDALHSIFKDKTENKEKNEKKKKLVELILKKDVYSQFSDKIIFVLAVIVGRKILVMKTVKFLK